jgi:hypothetical protein
MSHNFDLEQNDRSQNETETITSKCDAQLTTKPRKQPREKPNKNLPCSTTLEKFVQMLATSTAFSELCRGLKILFALHFSYLLWLGMILIGCGHFHKKWPMIGRDFMVHELISSTIVQFGLEVVIDLNV